MKKILISLCTGAMLISSSGVCGSKGLSDGASYKNSINIDSNVILGTLVGIGSLYGVAAVIARTAGQINAKKIVREYSGYKGMYSALSRGSKDFSTPFETLNQSYLNGFAREAGAEIRLKPYIDWRITEPVGASLYEGMSQAFKTGFKNAACNPFNIVGAVALGYYAAKKHLSDENA